MAEYCFYVVGEEEEKETVTAEDFLDELANEKCVTVRLQDCVIEGEVNISEAGVDVDENGRFIIDKELVCKSCTFIGEVNFREKTPSKEPKDFKRSTFKKKVSFRKTTFKDDANFNGAIFEGNVDFYGVSFKGDAYFNQASFNCETVNFTGIKCTTPIYLSYVRYWRNTIFNKWLRTFFPLIPSKITYPPENQNNSDEKPKYKYPSGKPCKEVDFQIDSQNIDEVNSPRFKRYVADQQFIRAFQQEHPLLAGLWRWSSDYGRLY